MRGRHTHPDADRSAAGDQPPTPDPTPSSVGRPRDACRPGGPRAGRPDTPPGGGADHPHRHRQAGVEPNCLLLDGYLLVGGPRDVLNAGARVTVTGRVSPA